MLLRKWEDIPEFMRNDEVKKYYDILNKKKVSLLMKRIFDVVMAIILLLILSPIFLILALWIKLDSHGPVFYRQERVTQYGKVFRIFKFRTMIVNADKKGSLVTLKDDNRITKVGKVIRKFRLDELPQLFNILLGEMSFVGTRPEVKKYVDSYTNEMKATLLLPAGVTSLASIAFKKEDEIITSLLNDDLAIDEIYINQILPVKMQHNLIYIKQFNIFKDVIICAKTIL